jgi:hypothetical protein
MAKGIYEFRARNHHNPFRQMVHETKKEMDKVIGKLDQNGFIKQRVHEMKGYREKVNSLSGKLKLCLFVIPASKRVINCRKANLAASGIK